MTKLEIMMNRPVITGVGPLTPAGTGRDVFWESVLRGDTFIKEVSKISSVPGAKGGEAPNVDIDDFMDGRKFRRAAEISKYSMVAVSCALSDSGTGPVDSESTSLVFGITHGAINYSQIYHRSLITGGIEDVSPILFSDSVLNAPAGNGSICFGIKGAVHTIVGDITASVKAIKLACSILRAGAVSRSIVVSAEEINELSYFCRSKLGETLLSEGAGAILIEREDDVRSAQPYCYISGYASYFDAVNPEYSIRRSIEKCLHMAGINEGDLAFALADMPPGSCPPGLEDIPSGSIAGLTGNAFNVTATWNIILSALVFKNGAVPSAIIDSKRSGGTVPLEKGHILVCNSEVTGASSAVVLSRYQ